MIEGRSIRRKHDLASRRERHFVISAIASGIGALAAGIGAAGAAAGAAGGIGAAIGTAIPAIAAGAAVAGTTYGIVAGERGAKMQRQAMGQQQAAQQQAATRARSQQRQAQEAMAMANRRQPDISQALAAGMADQGGGPASTMLTGPGGVQPGELMLGRQSLLGS